MSDADYFHHLMLSLALSAFAALTLFLVAGTLLKRGASRGVRLWTLIPLTLTLPLVVYLVMADRYLALQVFSGCSVGMALAGVYVADRRTTK